MLPVVGIPPSPPVLSTVLTSDANQTPVVFCFKMDGRLSTGRSQAVVIITQGAGKVYQNFSKGLPGGAGRAILEKRSPFYGTDIVI